MIRESHYTRPHADCANPGLWTAHDAYSTEIEVTALIAAFVRALQPGYVVETGTCWGYTAEAIGQALQANGHGHLDTLEVSGEKVTASRERCAGLPVTVHELSSLEFTPARDIGFAFFDSLLDLRMPEFHRYLPYLPVGTIVGFHDTSPHMGDLGATVAAEVRLSAIRLRTPRGVTFAEVTA